MRCAIVLLLLGAWAAPLRAAEAEEKRLVIALFDGGGKKLRFDFEDPVHQVYEMPLNYLGLVVRRHDVRLGPPPAEWLPRARAVLTAFTDAGETCWWLWPWLEKQVAAHGLRVLHLGDFGPLYRPEENRHDSARLKRWLHGFGLEYDDRYVEGPLGIRVEYRDRALCAFEADPARRAVHRGPRSVARTNRTWVTTRFRLGTLDERTPVVTGPWGGVALAPWVVDMGDENEERRWFLQLFAFFREALDLEGVPAAQPQVLLGRRMFFLHIDGDGFESLSTVRAGEMSAKITLDEVLTRYRLPYTVSIIVRSLTDDYDVAEPTPAMALARTILNLPQVEPASHGVLHPLRWDFPLTRETKPHTATWYPSLRNYDYSAVHEVRESVRFINERLLDEGRTCQIMLWTGATNAPRAAVEECARVGCLNLNGGVFRWDRWFDSISFVSPWSRMLGDAIQVYAGAANENDFEGFFDTMPGAYGHVDETITRTGGARILKPANIYIHFYSAERPARLAALHRLIRRWALAEETAPVFASRYARAVEAAIRGGRIFRTPNGWSLRDFGDCPTVRIDGEKRFVDWARSRGLAGARRVEGALYLHLTGADAQVVFSKSARPRPHVEQANHDASAITLAPDGVSLLSEAFSPRVVGFAGFPPAAELEVTLDGETGLRRADETGRFLLELKDPGRTEVRVRTRPSAR